MIKTIKTMSKQEKERYTVPRKVHAAGIFAVPAS